MDLRNKTKLMITSKDYIESKLTLKYIDHAKEGSRPLPATKVLEIFAFFLTGFNAIFFGANGKPKNLAQLILSIPAIIKFIRDTARMIFDTKVDSVQARRIAGLKGN